ncbi:MAG: helix-turn-helix transcriptional regulator [Propionibacteriaceae bacterium]|jgi:DNA-binding HxlR family transcriptional regulator|nr:helix-turn-helix transcriptional regulator [Propionibacteriaceae bacterium]
MATEKRCPIALTIALVGNKWKLFILRELLGGKRRFGELRRGISGISQKVLTDNLRAMERDGLVTRTVFPEVPPRVEYELTPVGRALQSVMDQMEEWGQEYLKLDAS